MSARPHESGEAQEVAKHERAQSGAESASYLSAQPRKWQSDGALLRVAVREISSPLGIIMLIMPVVLSNRRRVADRGHAQCT